MWQGDAPGNWDIFLSWWEPELANWADPIQVTNSSWDETSPQMAEGFSPPSSALVWQSSAEGNQQIYGMAAALEPDSLVFGEPTNLAPSLHAEVDPCLRYLPLGCVGTLACAWTHLHGDSADILFTPFLYDRPERVTSDPFPNRKPVISPVLGDTAWLAWESFRGGKWDIMAVRFHVPRGVVVHGGPTREQSWCLAQNYPNPFIGATTISFRLATTDQIAVEVYDVAGRKVRTLAEGLQADGWHQLRWDGRDARGVPLPAGVYFCRLKSKLFDKSIKMLYLPQPGMRGATGKKG
ncbi:MAG: T9SS type A sorting domain-containing protein [Calditrichaeota bacterium]|nr:T9SS type A sorting domain-containing protein [Calditrichota bacterium]